MNFMLIFYVGQQVYLVVFQICFYFNSCCYFIGCVDFNGLFGLCIIFVGEYGQLSGGQDVWLVFGIGMCDVYVVDEFDFFVFWFDFGVGVLDVLGLYVVMEEQQVGGGDESDVCGFLVFQFYCGYFVVEVVVFLVLEVMGIFGIVVDGIVLVGMGWLFVEQFEFDVLVVVCDDQ